MAQINLVTGYTGEAHIKSEEDARVIAKNLSEILEVDYDTVYAKTQKNNYYEVVKRKIEKDKYFVVFKYKYLKQLEDDKFSILEDVKSGDIIVMEVSCQQLENMTEFNPDVALMTNLSPAHIDFLKSYDNYKRVKTKLFANQTSKDIAILNNDNEDVLESTKDIKSTKKYFTSIFFQFMLTDVRFGATIRMYR